MRDLHSIVIAHRNILEIKKNISTKEYRKIIIKLENDLYNLQQEIYEETPEIHKNLLALTTQLKGFEREIKHKSK